MMITIMVLMCFPCSFSSSSPTSPHSYVPNHLTRLETDSSFGGTDYTASTQVISVASSAPTGPHRLQQPPPYIHPPGLDSPDIFGSDHRRSLTLSACSEKGEDYVFMQSVCSSNSPSAFKRAHDDFQFTKGDGSVVSTEKNGLEQPSSNEGTEQGEEGNTTDHYNHLPAQANLQQAPPSLSPLTHFAPPPPSHHLRSYSASSKSHPSPMGYGRSRSDDRVRRGGPGPYPQGNMYVEVRTGATTGSAVGMAPITVGQLVEQRLNAQSAEDGVASCDTYV